MDLDMSEIRKQLRILSKQKDLDPDTVLSALEKALGSAYRKDFGNRQQNIKFNFDTETGEMEAWDEKEVVEDISEEKLEESKEKFHERRQKAREEGRELRSEELEDLVRFNEKKQIMLSDAKEIDSGAEVGDTLKIDLEIPGKFGRMAAQTAKQVIIQKLREAERENVFEQFKDKEGQIVEGVIQDKKGSGNVIVDLDKINGLLPNNEQNPIDSYRPGMRLIFYVKTVQKGNRGPEIILSRASKELVRIIFEKEIPEIEAGEVEIKSIARDPGKRSKVAVHTDDDSIDPIGACIGRRGSRITTIIDELGGEKVDVIEYSEQPHEFIKNSLSPAESNSVELNEDNKEATVYVPSDQFSLAIGKQGQNVRLAAQLTGWVINVVEEGEEEAVSSDDEVDELEEQVEFEDGEDSDTDIEEAEGDAEDSEEGDEEQEDAETDNEEDSEESEEEVEQDDDTDEEEE